MNDYADRPKLRRPQTDQIKISSRYESEIRTPLSAIIGFSTIQSRPIEQKLIDFVAVREAANT